MMRVDLTWLDRALCAETDPDGFHREPGDGSMTLSQVKRVCLACEVRDECLEYALANDERFGIWGGMSEHERRKVKKRRIVLAEQRRDGAA